MRTAVRVEQALEYHPELRSSDKKLLLHEWEKDGLFLTDTQKQIFINKCTTAESITRARRKLKVKYPGTKQVEEARYGKFEQYRGGDYD
jgi:SHS2 domain-containing protein